ncbi:uncharacterized protein TRIADDRAFT_61760 [Trichoplax adhaerens]|uniref:EDRF1 N-terminal domain-containing protein n=1 Tax=Trichoplax adhaerens TaxID=10228 RepID=B3SBW5_TRIAD|nr:hypothetical protein TRIADDRAFT_61760 [Trichoplax adhaerens]EDV19745.1 hypothetical protein TRIADDRAFT_61760 [Trichoplax adhaerens]|eukprot:XP_002117769.1 hypothetical protein TRIADDRAFT_61760 [Trichoplax adhaerens]
MPFSPATVSLAVHRIGKTLLLDEFNVDRLLADATKIENWDWLKNFYCEQLNKPKAAFQQNVIWKFENIKMLVGSNMPIFGRGTHPAVSLRHGEFGKPINVLTGLDYWLDNLMCNVPELAMCYHLNGIVKLIKDIARNILSFLKSNCTQEGHTYWLLKDKHEDIIKLYDLTSLCAEIYTLANQMLSELLIDITELKSGCQCIESSTENSDADQLLKYECNRYCDSCIKCLPSTRNETSVTKNIIVNETSVVNFKAESTDDILFSEVNTRTPKPIPVVGNSEENYRKALKHISQGLESTANIRRAAIIEAGINIRGRRLYQMDKTESCLACANAKCITNNKCNHSSLRKKNEELSESCFSTEDSKYLSTIIFMKQAKRACLKLAHIKDLSLKYGAAVRFLKLSLACDEFLLNECRTAECQFHRNSIQAALVKAGDIFLKVTKVPGRIRNFQVCFHDS